MRSIKVLVFTIMAMTVGSQFGFTAEELVPPAVSQIDEKYLDGALLVGLEKMEDIAAERLELAVDMFDGELESALAKVDSLKY